MCVCHMCRAAIVLHQPQHRPALLPETQLRVPARAVAPGHGHGHLSVLLWKVGANTPACMFVCILANAWETCMACMAGQMDGLAAVLQRDSSSHPSMQAGEGSRGSTQQDYRGARPV